MLPIKNAATRSIFFIIFSFWQINLTLVILFFQPRWHAHRDIRARKDLSSRFEDENGDPIRLDLPLIAARQISAQSKRNRYPAPLFSHLILIEREQHREARALKPAFSRWTQPTHQDSPGSILRSRDPAQ